MTSELEQLIKEQQREMRYGNRVHQHGTVSLDKEQAHGSSLGDILGNDGRLHFGRKPKGREKLFHQSCPIHGATHMVIYGSSSTSLQCKACNRGYQYRYYHHGGGKEYQRRYYSQPHVREKNRLRERARREAKDPGLRQRRLERLERSIAKKAEALAKVTRAQVAEQWCFRGHDVRWGGRDKERRCTQCRRFTEREAARARRQRAKAVAMRDTTNG